MEKRYIIVWRRSPTARHLDVQLDTQGKIAVFSSSDSSGPVVSDENELLRYVNSNDSQIIQVEAHLAHKVLGWDVP